ncbi:hypothetical protein M407DRAFT_198622 [Tulasnella calospora MUT 4182]|uniref:Acyl-CoA thioesterase-like N-terminal HotDog domain-containing protein n=1 Tax=Tulasnella calospora MUT 4182 TaxID=1051891 RepID=A0A0C3MHX3_9AGAM|nr:hypothetical protein M407DRAFT_198622 [Tulasnella calospora MUT 4182]
MAPLSEATRTTYKKTLEDGTKVYECVADSQWALAVVTFEGYSLGLIVDAARQFQASTSHTDIIHLSSQFLRASTPGLIEIRVSKDGTDNQFTHLKAELRQMNTSNVTVQLIFGNFDEISTSEVAGMSLASSYVPLHPLSAHPSEGQLAKPHWAQRFHTHYTWAHDIYFAEKSNRVATQGKNVDGFLMGTWVRLLERKSVKMSPAYIPFFAEMIQPPWDLLPANDQGERKFWYPSLSITISFKCRLPLSQDYASHTLGLFGWKRHMKDGIWSGSTEIWAAPSELGEQVAIDENWREKMACVAVSSQTAFMNTPEINSRYAGQQNSRL